MKRKSVSCYRHVQASSCTHTHTTLHANKSLALNERGTSTSSVGAKPTGLSKHNQELSIVWACSRHSQPESMQQFMHVYNGNFGWQMHNNNTRKVCERGNWVHGGFYK